METYKCTICLEIKVESEYYFRKNGKLQQYYCKICCKNKRDIWRKKPEVEKRLNGFMKKWLIDNKERRLQIQKESNRKTRLTRKLLAINKYSDNKNVCNCCSEIHIEFLTIDHIDGGGNEHRKITGAGSAFYFWLKKNNYPSGYQVLCFNCNCGKSVNKLNICPHKIIC